MANKRAFIISGAAGFIVWLDDLESTAFGRPDDIPPAAAFPEINSVASGISDTWTRMDLNLGRRFDADKLHSMINTGDGCDHADDLISFLLREIVSAIAERISNVV